MPVETNEINNFTDINIELSDDERELMELIDDFSMAIEQKNIEKIMSFYSDEVVAFDLMPPLKYVGKSEYRKAWQNITKAKGPFVFEFHDLHLESCSDVAFCHSLVNMQADMGDGEMNTWIRYTGGFRKINGSWRIVHESTSVPIDMNTQKGMFDLRP